MPLAIGPLGDIVTMVSLVGIASVSRRNSRRRLGSAADYADGGKRMSRSSLYGGK